MKFSAFGLPVDINFNAPFEAFVHKINT